MSPPRLFLRLSSRSRSRHLFQIFPQKILSQTNEQKNEDYSSFQRIRPMERLPSHQSFTRRGRSRRGIAFA